MKRFVIALMTAALALVAVTGCTIDDDLSGQVWESSEGVTLTFSGMMCIIKDGSVEDFYDYTYISPTVNLTPHDAKAPKLQGVISGSTMTVKNMENQETFGVFKRQ